MRIADTPWQREATGVIRRRNGCPSSRHEKKGDLFCDWNVELAFCLRAAAPATDTFIERHD